MRYRLMLLLAACLNCVACDGVRGAEIDQRWVYLQLNLQVSENVTKASAIMRRAAAAGYNGIVLADYKLNILDRVPDHYFRNIDAIQKLATELNLELIPTVAPIGYSDGLLAHDPNLVEGLPARNVPFVVKDGEARLESDLKTALPGGDFESHQGNSASGWSFQDGPGKASFVDPNVKHQGNASLRWENLESAAAPSGNGRVSRVVKVAPWRQYHLSVWIKTENFDSANSVRLFAMGSDGHVLSFSDLGVKRTQDWQIHHVVFNSLGNEEVRVYCGTWGGRGGRLWMDDVKMDQIALVNLVRRHGCPFTVADPAGKPFEEGRDFAKILDEKMGKVPYAGSFDVFHDPPKIKVLPGGRIREGDRLQVSFFQDRRADGKMA